tara:strand:- start:128 stop:2017 length:1890 start_codon:yes stop_codon:yes gene_type:complete
MCGIAGHINFSSSISKDAMAANVQTMCRAIQHRGPDEHGIYSAPDFPVVLGHQRLSILDLSTGQQPLKNQAGDLVIVFNGEIYNYRELRSQLQAKGHAFITQSDTEVIVQAYNEWGVQCVSHLSGMFAFSIWDRKRKRLFCARDRLGVKPFYYYWDKRNFVFSSEIKGILANRLIDKTLNIKPLSSFLHTSYCPGEQTFFDNIYKLSPGHTLTVEEAGINIQKYWSISDVTENGNQLSFDDASLVLRDNVEKSVKSCLMGDVPIGAFLSGGVDSSTIVALMSKHQNDPVLTHCVGFNSLDSRLDERQYAAEVARLFSSNHWDDSVEIDVGGSLDKIIWHMDEPYADSSAIPTYYLCKETRKRVKVCLSGDGGDEIFAGYNWYQELLSLSQSTQKIPEWFKKGLIAPISEQLPYNIRGATFLKNIGATPQVRHQNLTNCFDAQHIHRLLRDDVLTEVMTQPYPLEKYYSEIASSWDDVKAAQFVDMKSYLVEDILMKVDKMSMAHSLEVRVPLLEHKVVEFAFSQPTEYKMHGEQRKMLLKNCMSDLLPKRIMDRKKQGFTAPLREWLLSDLKERVGDLLLSGQYSKSGVFKTKEVADLWRQFEKKGCRVDLSRHIWTLLCFEMWHQQYL